MPFLDGVRGRLHYRRWPVDHPRAVLALLPGTGQHSGHYHWFGRTLGAEDIELWTLDTAGHGLSEGDRENPGSLPELAADALLLLAEIRSARSSTPAFLMGHSLGAATALTCVGYAPMSVPLAGVVLCGTPRRALGPPLPESLPVLAVHGVDDRRTPIGPIQDWTERLQTVHLLEYADAGHDLLHEPVRTRVSADIATWIHRVLVGRAGRRVGCSGTGHT